MGNVHYKQSDIVVAGWSCRLPGATGIAAYWSLLQNGHCSVGKIPSDRWSLDRFGHPGRARPGKSYTWAAGVLDTPWAFDPTLFGISPREAEQMDPQQRILLELTWEALEDAGIPPSTIAGTDVGVFVGGSSTDFANLRTADPSGGDAHFATGNALSILANRISYVYDFKGPSLTIDTACSSSLVALHHAVEALNGRSIDTAIVGGINFLASPYSFISFSQAGMLSPRGRCHSFSAEADGYVRAEGGAVLVLRRLRPAEATRYPGHGLIVGTGVNSDGRTAGIALPSGEAQQRLMEEVYAGAGVRADDLAFIEAHGTGTAVGDPIEAGAIGRALGQSRNKPLLIGSAKSNVGHLEPAAGLVGLIKALLALRHGILPGSLHCAVPNPAIPFGDLNVEVATSARALCADAGRFAGVNSFGFGGTNAHAIVSVLPPARAALGRARKISSVPLLISADNSGALAALSGRYAMMLAGKSPAQVQEIAYAAATGRELLAHRLLVSATSADDMIKSLQAAAARVDDAGAVAGIAAGRNLPVAFVYSGNGSQWPGMGCRAYESNAQFRTTFDAVDALFTPLAGWSLKAALFDPELALRLRLTSIAQPLLFAIQVAATAALVKRGIRPVALVGHSVGEVAAAHASGALDLETAVSVIHYRSLEQELTAGAGDMAVLFMPTDAVSEFIATIPDLEIAAFNSPGAVAVSGSDEALSVLARTAEDRGIRTVALNLGYPFHSAKMAPIEHRLLFDLDGMALKRTRTPFISTVTGKELPGEALDANYWWQNVRAPVQFATAVRSAAEMGARLFVEIGPKAILQRHVRDCLEADTGPTCVVSVFSDKDMPKSGSHDEIEKAVATAVVGGAAFETATLFGPPPPIHIELPTYPWQHRDFRLRPTPGAIDFSIGPWHPLSGGRHIDGGLEWRAHLDTTIMPELADHVVAGQAILPGAAFIEIAISVGRQWLDMANVVVTDLELIKPLGLAKGEEREVLTRVSAASRSIEILSRPHLSTASWVLHARGKLFAGTPQTGACVAANTAVEEVLDADQIYDIARASGLDYGPAFRRVRSVSRHSDKELTVEIIPPEAGRAFHLNPMSLDACFHGLFALFPSLGTASRDVAYIPVRFDEVDFHAAGGTPNGARIEIRKSSRRSILADFTVFDAHGETVARLVGARFTAVQVRRKPSLDHVAYVESLRAIAAGESRSTALQTTPNQIVSRALDLASTDVSPASSDAMLLLDGWATAAAYEIATGLSEDGIVDLDGLRATNRLPEAIEDWLIGLLSGLRAAGLAEIEGRRWRLDLDPLLPSSASVLASIASEYPSRASEILLASDVTAFAKHIQLHRSISPDSLAAISAAAWKLHEQVSPDTTTARDLLERIVVATGLPKHSHSGLRVLLIGGARSVGLFKDLERVEVSITVYDPAGGGAERWRQVHGDAIAHIADAKDLPDQSFDLVLAAGVFSRIAEEDALGEFARSLSSTGLLVAIEPVARLFDTLVTDLHKACGDDPVVRRVVPRLPAHWCDRLTASGFEAVAAGRMSAEGVNFVVMSARASPSKASSVESNGVNVEFISLGEKPLVVSLAGRDRRLLPALASRVGVLPIEVDNLKLPEGKRRIDVIAVLGTDRAVGSAEQLSQRCLDIAALVRQFGNVRPRLWIVHGGALGLPGEIKPEPVETATWAFCRTLANEHSQIDIRRVDIEPQLSGHDAAGQLLALLQSDTNETEIQIGPGGVRAVRIERLRSNSAPGPASTSAVRLKRSHVPGQRIHWQPMERVAPGPGQIEIAVEATGLNFRDLMWSMEMLPDDMLEDGFTGPSLGLECAGRVTRIGSGVTTVRKGDRVVTLAPAAFSTHVVVDERFAAEIPAHMSAEAAATIPVAFLTAYYALVSLARMQEGEWVLIHGAAGGVGLAALQLAQLKKVQVIATAGSSAKRNLLSALGAEHVLDSRSTSFVSEIRSITGAGVDVVLNSLAGPAMERSLQCLCPFGRFVELGKRDYVENTHVGLRPFRRNLTYFGVDIDQLMTGRRELGQQVFNELFQLIRDDVLKPLPHSVFDASRVAEAFQLMQKSSHIGKIVIRPPDPRSLQAALPAFSAASDRTHLVTGAFGGFGRETVKWLVRRGARYLVLIGRRGPGSECDAELAEYARNGVRVVCEACDVADAMAMEALFKRIRSTMPPLAGVMHAAMVIEDALVGSLNRDQLSRVLAPKVTGADNLDRLTRADGLDYFVLFSSVTSMLGNPGQGSYVAANAYMEGLARRRRQEGLPALAVGWGPISDVGIVARSDKLKANLLDRHGMTGMVAAQALDLMGEALAVADHDDALAVVTFASQDWTLRSTQLGILKAPTHAALFGKNADGSQRVATTVNLHELAGEGDPVALKRQIRSIIAGRLASVLHAREDDLDQTQPLFQMGLDSLMAFELSSSLEQALGVQVALDGTLVSLSIAGLADKLIAQVGRKSEDSTTEIARSIAAKHIWNVTEAQVEELAAFAKPVFAASDPKRVL